MSSQEYKSKKRSAEAMSLEQFAFNKAKGTSRAIKKYREKKEKQFTRKAGLLKKYKKAMKKEGFEAGKGASRKRSLSKVNEQNNDEIKETTISSHNPKNSLELPYKKKRLKKTDPLAKAKAAALQRKEEKVRDLEERELQKQQHEKKISERKKRSRVMMKRTRRGQPIMKNIITGLLGKLEEERK